MKAVPLLVCYKRIWEDACSIVICLHIIIINTRLLMSVLIFLGRSKEKAVTMIITESFRLLTLLGRGPIDPAAPPWLLAPSGSAFVGHWPSAASGLHSSGYTSSIWLCQAPPSLRLHLGPQSLQLHCGFMDLLCLLCLGPLDPQHHPGSSALHLGLYHHLLCHCRLAPRSRQLFSSSMDRHYSYGLGPAWLLLLQVPHVFSLAPPSVWSTLVPPFSSMAPPSVF